MSTIASHANLVKPLIGAFLVGLSLVWVDGLMALLVPRSEGAVMIPVALMMWRSRDGLEVEVIEHQPDGLIEGQWRVLREFYRWAAERLGAVIGWAVLPTLLESIGFVWGGSHALSPLLIWAFGLPEILGPPVALALLQLAWHLPHI
ncbi:MAG: hypothetical protein AAB263_15050, partial [Planctomycetota bacterium]